MSSIAAAIVGGVAAILRGAELLRARRRIARWPVLNGRAVTDDSFAAVHCLALDAVAPAMIGAAVARMHRARLDALDLVPANLSMADTLELASIVDVDALAANPFTRTAGAGAAVVARRALIDQAGIATPPRDSADVSAAIERLRRFAVGRTGIAVAPGLAAPPDDVNRATMLGARTGINKGPRLYVEGAWWGLVVAALIADWRVGVATCVALSVAPTLTFVGLSVQPHDRWLSLVTRLPVDLSRWCAGLLGRDTRAADAANALRPSYASLSADEFSSSLIAERRAQCPMCGSVKLKRAVSSGDVVQAKPGRFTMDRCAGCGIVFQNPPLSPSGLNFYYRDFYDGLGADAMDEVFASTHGLYEKRIASMIAEGISPKRWLDVGCGYAHFSLAARRRLPEASFEGLDRSDSVEVGVARGWLDRAWRQSAGEVAETGERFDVVSMFHLLEHTTDPAAEIAAAARLLAPGGRLVIEIPNPQCRLGGWLGRWWFPWFQPQHQFLLNESTVRRIITAAGLRTTKVEYLMTTGDVLLASMLAVRSLASVGEVPWAESPGLIRRAADAVLWAASMPIFLTAIVVDAAYNALPDSPRTSNAFRITAAAE